ncbi:hypothetical protein EVAR_56199_1 [Eumeta japonica]|uniref:Uncharacterized protein n=1 Tax=Eumeta variegata TaxID=151549 RepID=A0A4C1Y833_EUMVA|nr:hypothetical protein EVAR_56199_1 [Eumeta japonica]
MEHVFGRLAVVIAFLGASGLTARPVGDLGLLVALATGTVTTSETNRLVHFLRSRSEVEFVEQWSGERLWAVGAALAASHERASFMGHKAEPSKYFLDSLTSSNNHEISEK